MMKLIQMGSNLYVDPAKIIAFEDTTRKDKWLTVIYVDGGIQLLSDWLIHIVAAKYHREYDNASNA